MPEGSMLTPRYPAAVVAGNVESVQAVIDALFGALGALGSAQGTMNNLTFGDATPPVLRDDLLRRAGRPRLRRRERRAHPHDQLAPDRPGSSGEPLPGRAGGLPHPPRLGRQGPLERRRRHAAAHPLSRADGARAAYRPPRSRDPGMAGGEPGELGRNIVRRNDGRHRGSCPAVRRPMLEAGEAIEIVTPTGGGWGAL